MLSKPLKTPNTSSYDNSKYLLVRYRLLELTGNPCSTKPFALKKGTELQRTRSIGSNLKIRSSCITFQGTARRSRHARLTETRATTEDPGEIQHSTGWDGHVGGSSTEDQSYGEERYAHS